MKKLLYDLFDIAKTVIIVLILAFLIRNFLFQPFVVEGQSMEPNFYDKEYILVNRMSYRVGDIQRGDVVVFQAPNNPQYDYIKRVIGLPSETIKVKDQKIYVNDELIEENYINNAETQSFLEGKRNFNLEVTLDDNEYFVLGDNRDHSSDSREWGTLPKGNIVGKAWFTVYPWNIFGFIPSQEYSI